MSLLTHVLRRAAVDRLAALRRLAAFPRLAQERVLRTLVRRARKTHFGRHHDLGRVRSCADFRAAVPLRDHDGYRPYLEAARAGEPDVLRPGRVPHWALPAGTRGGGTLLPVTRETIRSHRAGAWDALTSFLAQGRHDLLGGTLLFLGGPTRLHKQGDAWVADGAGLMGHHPPRLMRRWLTPRADVAVLGDGEEELCRAARLGVRQDVRMLSGLPAWILRFGDEVLAEARRQGRAADRLLDVWPNLRLVVHAGRGTEPQRQRLLELVGGPLWWTDTYAPTAGGVLAVQDRADEEALLPLVDRGTFLEFVPREDLGAANPTRLGLHEVRPGVDYAVAVSTGAGLFAYLLGDVVRFTATVPPRLVLAGRLAPTVESFGARVGDVGPERALVSADAAGGAHLREFAVAAHARGAGLRTAPLREGQPG
jgi:hypothetical protein